MKTFTHLLTRPLWGVLLTLLTTAALVAALWGMGRLFPWIYARLEAWRGTVIPSIKIQRLEVLSADRLTDALLATARGVRLLATVIVAYVYLTTVFGFFPWTRGVSEALAFWILDPLRRAGSGFVGYLPDLFTIAVIIAVVHYLLKFIRMFFAGLERGAIALPGFHGDWAEPTYKLVRFIVLVFAAIMIFPYLPGSDTAGFRGISIFLGVLVSLGSASAISNIIAGVVIVYMRPFQIGDRVKIAETVGDVSEKTLLVTRVRTSKNVEITIPNSMVLSNHIINYSAMAKKEGVIFHTTVTLGYDLPWEKVHEALVAAALATDGILKEPKPFVLQTKLDDWYVHYELNAYTDNPNAMQRIYSDLHQNMLDKCAEAGIEIMSPSYYALRDGNEIAVPADYIGKDYKTPAFRVKHVGSEPPS